MDEIIDSLQIKIERAKRDLPLETVNAINAVDWKNAIVGLRGKLGYNFEQLGVLELETELLLCGLTSTQNYAKELKEGMRLSSTATNELIEEMNNAVFKKIRQELIKNEERKKTSVKNEAQEIHPDNSHDIKVLNSHGIDIIPEKLEITSGKNPIEHREEMIKNIEKPAPTPTILTQKLSGPTQSKVVKTDHTLGNLTSNSTQTTGPKVDPYRMPIE